MFKRYITKGFFIFSNVITKANLFYIFKRYKQRYIYFIYLNVINKDTFY